MEDCNKTINIGVIGGNTRLVMTLKKYIESSSIENLNNENNIFINTDCVIKSEQYLKNIDFV